LTNAPVRESTGAARISAAFAVMYTPKISWLGGFGPSGVGGTAPAARRACDGARRHRARAPAVRADGGAARDGVVVGIMM
jgi:hypothetical protein